MVPSQTELLFYLGLDARVVGVTKFCINPAKARTNRAVVGGTKHPDVRLIRSLKPDLIVGNKEENDKATIEILRAEFPVWLSDVVTMEDACGMIADIGLLTNTQPKATHLINQIRSAFEAMPVFKAQTVVYLVWRKPWMAAGTQTFIHSILQAAGLKNVVVQSRYPELSLEHIAELRPDFIFLSSEPYPFSHKHIAEFKYAVPEAQVVLVDGEMFSWYGNRLLAAPAYFQVLNTSLTPTADKSSQNAG